MGRRTLDDEEQKQIIAENLRYYLELHGMTQLQLADAIGEKKNTVNNWCTGKAMPSVSKIQKVCDYFHILKSNIVDKPDSDHDAILDANMIANVELRQLIIKYLELSADDQLHIKHLIEDMHKYYTIYSSMKI